MKLFKSLFIAFATSAILISASASATTVHGVNVYYSNNGPGMAGTYAQNSMIRFYNNTTSNINCRVTSANGSFKQTGWIAQGNYKNLNLPQGRYSWYCWYI
ncbi:MAG: hypothetical protein ACI9TY_001442 [Alphaproteobacteria bacterium]|jgi:hypothetical protein